MMDDLKSKAIDAVAETLEKRLDSPMNLEMKKEVVDETLIKIEEILRHYKHSVQQIENGLCEGFIFVAWFNDDIVHTRIIKY